MSEEYAWRVVITRHVTKSNPKYRYWDQDSTEPRYFILDETTESISKFFVRKGDAKSCRTRSMAYGEPGVFVSAVIQKAKLDWQTLAEDEL